MTSPSGRDPYAPPDRQEPLPPAAAGPAPHQPPPPLRPPVGPQRPVPPPADAQVVRAGRRAAVTGVAGLVLSVLLFPVGLVLDVAAIVLGVRARRAAPAGTRVPGAVAGVALGAVGVLVASTVLAVTAANWSSVRRYEQCSSGANTGLARQDCQDRLRRDLERRFGSGD